MNALQPQLAEVLREFDDVTQRARRLAARLDDAAFARRPAPERWSPAECIAHLSLTSDVYFPIIRSAIAEGRTLAPARGRYRRDLTGWFLSRSLEPESRVKIKTPARFEPTKVAPRPQVIADFARKQDELSLLLREASGLDLRRLKVASPFNPNFKYNLYSCFKIHAAHERRHLAQAEAAAGA